MKSEEEIDIKRIKLDIRTVVVCIIFIVGIASANVANYYAIKLNSARLENKIDLMSVDIAYLKKDKK